LVETAQFCADADRARPRDAMSIMIVFFIAV